MLVFIQVTVLFDCLCREGREDFIGVEVTEDWKRKGFVANPTPRSGGGAEDEKRKGLVE
jgi:hypothetical protein